jgi:hypothetical protein
MKGKGAALTDAQVPLLVEYLVRTAGSVTVTAPDGAAKGKAGGKGAPKGGRCAAKNLKVLAPAALPAAKQGFEELGLLDKGVCSYWHAEDRASDEKMQKVIARGMIVMMRDINAAFADGKQHATCYTCHRGSPTPATAAR